MPANLVRDHPQLDWNPAEGTEMPQPAEDGYVLPMTALLLVPLLLFAAFAVDVGGWYVQAQQAQAAADAASLSGVPWLPNVAKAEQVARETAARNGYVDQPGCDGLPEHCSPTAFPQVIVRRTGTRELQVDIFTGGDSYLGRMVMPDQIALHRYGVAEYVLPVPLGNPTSALGMGTEEAGGITANFWLRAMTDCEPRSTGDFIGAGGGCPNTNPNHRDEGHTFIVDVPLAGSYTVQARTTCAEFGGQQANASMRFRLFDVDDTPYDDDDNVLDPPIAEIVVPRPDPSICATDGSDWSPTSEPAPWVDIATVNNPGRYVLQAKNPDHNANIRSLYSLRVVPVGHVGTYSCSRIGSGGTSGCPNIFAKDYLTSYTHAQMFPSATIGQALLYLAEIEETHAGKTMEVELFDPADGIDSVRIVDPHGNYQNLSWYTIDCLIYGYQCGRGDLGSPAAPITQSCSGVPCLKQAPGISFQDRTIKILIPLDPSYTCAEPVAQPVDCWWKVEYEDSNTNANETTTWGVTVTGDPVRLVE